MMTLGELAALIAYEVNQPRTSVVTNGAASLPWLNHEAPTLDEVRGAVESMTSDAKRVNDGIQRVRALSEKADPERALLQVNDVIRDVVRLAQHEALGKEASLRLGLAPALPSVLGDRIQPQQVIINLVIDGIQAIKSITERPRELLIRSQQSEEGRCWSASRTPVSGSIPSMQSSCSTLFSPQNQTALAWACRFAVRSSRSTVDACGLSTIKGSAAATVSPYSGGAAAAKAAPGRTR
jgi:signal transduction histidine kinase